MTKIAGIDLGTTFSAIAHLNDMGKPEIVPTADGERILPSAIYFSADKILTGVEAINGRRDNVSRSVRWIKRHMGDADHKTLIDGVEYSPAELSAIILKKLYQDAANQVGAVTHVVISVPANFGEVARKATMDAGKIAGLNVIGIVNEPTAAALYYAIEHKVSGRVLVFDLGGGTFDVSIADVAGRDVSLVTSQGDRDLGGYNFDQKLVEWFEKKYQDGGKGVLCRTPEERADIEVYAETIKKTLSKQDRTSATLKGENGSLKVDVLRGEFESLISSYLARIEMLIETALEGAECAPSDITKVLLAGGSSRIPAVQRLLKKMFGYEPTLVGNVDECVALGAALYAGLRLMEESPEQVPAGIKGALGSVNVNEISNHSFGTFCLTFDDKKERMENANDFIIPKNTPIPCNMTKTYFTTHDGQKRVSSEVTQGESTDPDYVNVIAGGTLELPSGLPANSPIKASYSYDKDQRMNCIFEHEDSKRKIVINIDIKSGAYTTESIIDKRAKLEDFVIE